MFTGKLSNLHTSTPYRSLLVNSLHALRDDLGFFAFAYFEAPFPSTLFRRSPLQHFQEEGNYRWPAALSARCARTPAGGFFVVDILGESNGV